MNKSLPAALLAFALLASPALAGPPTEAQKAQFYKTCMGIAQDDALCSCKRDATTRLIDEQFMDIVVAAMQGKTPPDSAAVPYNDYIARSNQICKPGY